MRAVAVRRSLSVGEFGGISERLDLCRQQRMAVTKALKFDILVDAYTMTEVGYRFRKY
jgi:hypothetical protein